MLKENNKKNIICHNSSVFAKPKATLPGDTWQKRVDERSEQGSHKILHFVQNCDVALQQGRSMVEMLGVLAVMGVLSVGGITMYTSAMNKHRANELLSEALKRAMAVSAQIVMMGREAPDTASADMLGEFSNPSGYVFRVQKKNTTKFNLTLSKDPSGEIEDAICTQMKAATGDNSVVQLNTDCTEITFNNDLSKNNSSDQENSSNDPPTADCTGKENGTLCDVAEDTRFWGTCQEGSCVRCRCAWTDWFNTSHPQFGQDSGDYETYANIKAAVGGGICDSPLKLECRAAELPDVSLAELEEAGQVFTCALEVGFVCKNQDQPNQLMCLDYEIRTYCCDRSCVRRS